MSGGWDATEGRVPWRERRPEGWDGTGRMSLNEWWDDLVAPTRGILVARILIVCGGLGLLVEGGALVLPVSLLLWVMAATVRLRGQAPRRKPYVAPPPWRPPVDWTFESGDHAVELLAPGGTDDRVNTAAVRALKLLTDGSLRQVWADMRSTPCVVRRGVSRRSAETAVRLLEVSGARARVVPPDGGTTRA